jgi:hypothetical protein
MYFAISTPLRFVELPGEGDIAPAGLVERGDDHGRGAVADADDHKPAELRHGSSAVIGTAYGEEISPPLAKIA